MRKNEFVFDCGCRLVVAPERSLETCERHDPYEGDSKSLDE